MVNRTDPRTRRDVVLSAALLLVVLVVVTAAPGTQL